MKSSRRVHRVEYSAYTITILRSWMSSRLADGISWIWILQAALSACSNQSMRRLDLSVTATTVFSDCIETFVELWWQFWYRSPPMVTEVPNRLKATSPTRSCPIRTHCHLGLLSLSGHKEGLVENIDWKQIICKLFFFPGFSKKTIAGWKWTEVGARMRASQPWGRGRILDLWCWHVAWHA